MRRALLSLVAMLSLFTQPAAHAEGAQDYGVLIISRERLEIATSCEIGIYLQDQLAGRLFQEQSTSFNLPPGRVTVRLRQLPGQAPGCLPGIDGPNSTTVELRAGQISKYRIAMGQDGLYLKRAALQY
ncbi:hypothetical protein [Pseudomonas sp. R5(2019)]|uniref:hypothetical protein n=1 Tax=Pseudomonas sp. R5(2019) TaxID=2697566 RepID=UPI0014137707|nr:hypothetical protein [Pseudomonas sp. R5(2019)]NBA98431.1 hypothetical protein [Pseudomonas sp. R5(2019)]